MLKNSTKQTTNYLIKQLPTATAFINKKFEVIHASNLWIETFYYDNIEVFGKSIFQLFQKNKEWKVILQQCFSGQPSELFKLKIKDPNNNDQWFEWSSIPWYDSDENVIGAIITADNITSKIIDELQLNKLHALLKEKSEIAKIGTWEYDDISHKGEWCGITKEIYEAEESIELTLEKIINFYKDGYSRNRISMAVHNAMMKGTSWSEKLQIVTVEGNIKWVVSSGKPIYKEGEFQGLIGTIYDIDNQVIDKIKTKENEDLLKTLIDNLPVGVYVKNRNFQKILANKAHCESMKVKDVSEFKTKDDFYFFREDIAEQFKKEDIHILKSLKPILNKETISIKKDGTKTTLLNSKIPLTNNKGVAYGIIGISTDITHLKEKEEELRDLISVTSLQNKKLVNFAHIVSHNLRSHTANFSMLLDFLVNEKEKNEKEKILSMLRNASDNLLETLNNLNQVVAINSNTNLERTPIKIYDTIEQVRQNLSAYLKKNNAVLENEIPNKATIKVIPAYIDSIFLNFITNSIKYMKPNVAPKIKITLTKQKNYNVVSISDNGLGIDLEKYGDKLFGMYKTFHKHKDARGIGLYITKNQIEAMNGKITVTSTVGKGTTFNIHFNE